MEDFSQAKRLEMEKEVAGMYLSGHPMAAYAGHYRDFGAVPVGDVLEAGEGGSRFSDGDYIRLLGLVDHIQTKSSRSGEMAFVTLEDFYGSIEVLVFSRQWEVYRSLLGSGRVLCVSGRISVREEEAPKLLCDRVEDAEHVKEAVPQKDGAKKRGKADAPKPSATPPAPQPAGKHVKPGLYLRVSSKEDPALSARAPVSRHLRRENAALYRLPKGKSDVLRAQARRGGGKFCTTCGAQRAARRQKCRICSIITTIQEEFFYIERL